MLFILFACFDGIVSDLYGCRNGIGENDGIKMFMVFS